MHESFLSDNFVLSTDAAVKLYHDHAERMPIYDYHCHLSPRLIAEDTCFNSITEAWLAGDHYKWRAMRANGISEEYCTGAMDDEKKFLKWAETVPDTIRNPLFIWTHLELKRYFDIDELLTPETARSIYQICNKKLGTPEFSVKNLLRKMNVKVLCTTDDPCDSLEYHQAIRESGFEITVLPTFRPDKAMAVSQASAFNTWVELLEETTDKNIGNYESFTEALYERHGYFHAMGCRISDHGIEHPYAEDFSHNDIETLFSRLRTGKDIETHSQYKLKTALMIEFARMDYEKGWVQQIHMNALRNTNTRLYKALGPDTGFDSIGDWPVAQPLARFLSTLDQSNHLPKTILYTLNAADNDIIAAMAGNFNDGSVAGKMQFGSGWWFHDQRDGMEKQLQSLSNLGLLSRFIGMLTDSRSFLSYPRHEYFRRILCKVIGEDIALGELPEDYTLLGSVVENICFNNACEYFPIQL